MSSDNSTLVYELSSVVDCSYALSHRVLQELVLKYCPKIGDEGLVEIGKGCGQLQALHLVDCSAIGDMAIRNIALGCQQLRRLHVRRCYKVIARVNLFLPFTCCSCKFCGFLVSTISTYL